MPELLTITYYESISGEELHPYQPLKSGYIRSYWSKGEKYSAIIHKNIPVQSIGIEFTATFCDQFLAYKYGEKYVNPRQALTTLKATSTFSEMVILLRQIAAYRGSDLTSALFMKEKYMKHWLSLWNEPFLIKHVIAHKFLKKIFTILSM